MVSDDGEAEVDMCFEYETTAVHTASLHGVDCTSGLSVCLSDSM